MRLLYSPRNDPQTWNDPQMDPEMIPISLHVDPKMIPINSWNGSLLPRLRSWIAFNTSLQLKWFFSTLVI